MARLSDPSRRSPLALRICFAFLRVCAAIVPRPWRRDWRGEWEAEVRHHYDNTAGNWRTDMDLVRRALGALPDAAWIRRQFTTDAEAVHDLRHGARMLWKAPGFTVAAVLILAVGIGGTVSVVTLLDTLFFRSLPYSDADSVMTLWSRAAQRPGQQEDVAPADFLSWRDRARSFSHVAAAVPYSFDYTASGEPEVLFGAQVTEGFFEALGMRPTLGRTFLPAEHVRGGRRAVIITDGLWRGRFGADPSVLDRDIELDGVAWTIVGVLPREFGPQMLPRPGELSVWTPKVIQEHEHRIRDSAWWNVVARLRPGVTREEAQREMDTIATALAAEYPRSNDGRGVLVVPLREHLMGNIRLPLILMLAAVVLVLGIGCANVASLLLARGMDRARELAIRSALGAGRLRLVRQLVLESLLLSAVAAAAGLALAWWGVKGIVALAPTGIMRLHEATIDARIIGFAAVLTTVTAICFGVIPALQLSRPSRGALRERDSSGPGAHLRRSLVVAEIAFALVLLTGAGLLIRSFDRLISVDPGFRAENVVAVQVFIHDRNDTAQKVRNFFDSTISRMRSIPGVEEVGAVSAMPFATANIDIKSSLTVLGRDEGTAVDRGAYVTIAAPGYFRAMSIPLREGRFIEDRDAPQSPRVVVISDALAKREWPNESPIGRRIRIDWHGKPLEAEIVGVVSQLRHERLDRAARPELFLALAQVPFGSMTYVLRGSGDPRTLIDAARREIWAVDPIQTIYDSASLERLVDASLVRERFSMTLMTAFAVLALLLCASGIYGIISFTTAQRTREIGVRMALGADQRSIQSMVLREGSGVIAIGLVIGLAGAALTARYVQALLFEVRPGDPLTIGTVCLLLAVVGLAACFVPARRATRVDPLVALRAE